MIDLSSFTALSSTPTWTTAARQYAARAVGKMLVEDPTPELSTARVT